MRFYNSGGKHKTRISGIKTKACQLWENIKGRCLILPIVNERKFGKYSNVTIDDEWLDFQRFADWFDSVSYIDGWTLDKDLLGLNHYGPESCVFLPDEVNKALSLKTRVRGSLPIGVSYHGGKEDYVDIQYACKNPDFAFRKFTPITKMIDVWLSYYKPAREGYMKHLAEKYKDQIDARAYDALRSYEINIED